jgi:hypothetical protein
VANPLPLPPIVSGAIYKHASLCQQRASELHSTNVVGTATSTGPGSIWVPLTKTLSAGQPITARQINTGSDSNIKVAGLICAEAAVLSSGAGTFTFSASSALTVLNAEPACAESTDFTAETLNCLYGVLPVNPGNQIAADTTRSRHDGTGVVARPRENTIAFSSPYIQAVSRNFAPYPFTSSYRLCAGETLPVAFPSDSSGIVY